MNKSNSTSLRRESREEALQALFQWELSQNAYENPPSDEFSKILAEGTWKNRQAIDALIEKNSKNWVLTRINPLDISLLRLAIFEMKFLDPPTKKPIAINESLEIAKKFSTEKSAPFINGILNSIDISP